MSSLFRPKKNQEKPTPAFGTAQPMSPVTAQPNFPIPNKLPILPLKDQVLYPGTVIPIFIEDPKLTSLISGAQTQQTLVATILLKPSVNGQGPQVINKDSLFGVGTVSLVHRFIPVSQSGVMVVLQGVAKINLLDVLEENGVLWAILESVPEQEGDPQSKDLAALMRTTLSLAQKIIANTPYLPKELQIALEDIQEPLRLTYTIASSLRLDLIDKQSLLELPTALEKMKKLSALLNKEVQMFELGGKITEDVQKEFAKFSREAFLKQQLKQIKKELGEKSETEQEVVEFRKRLKETQLPEETQKEVEKEIDRLEKSSAWSPDAQVTRTYLDWVLSLPWNNETADDLDLKKAKEVLDNDHYGLKDIKERILEYLAVRKLKKDHKGPILCFVGPPGVGKTSLGQSIAVSMGRKFVRMSLGGVHDEAEIRGHRRTYIGALSGRLMQSIKRAGTRNPVLMLDEVDKVGADFRGDVSSALLEVLDPEQNYKFRDHYLDLDFDLSKVFFITTANVLDTIQPALRDRMEIIRLAGYTASEKLEIAKRHLLPKVVLEHGLSRDKVKFEDQAILKIIEGYTYEAGVRNLEREIAKVVRKVAKKIALKPGLKVRLRASDLESYLGPQKVFPEEQRSLWKPGIATGMAWTPAGGTIQFVEATAMSGKKGFLLTGQMGDVMKESAQAALSLVRTRADELGIDKNFFDKMDLHVHVPEGAVPKDGPSAGVTLTTSLVSLLSNKPVRKDVSMTGEITLSGLVLPIGGLKEKMLAAKRAGIKTIILPKRNEGELKEIDEELRKGLKFVLVETIDQVLKEAIPGVFKK